MSVKRKIIISALVVVILIGAIVYTIIIPTVNDIKEISNSVYLERVDLEKKYLRGQLLRKTIEDFEKIQPEKDKFSSIFVVKGEELEFITALETLANRNNLTQDIKLQATRENVLKGGAGALPLQILTRGGFINTMQYLRDIERLNYYFNVLNIELGVVSVNQGSNDPITLNISGNVYTTPKAQTEAEKQ